MISPQTSGQMRQHSGAAWTAQPLGDRKKKRRFNPKRKGHFSGGNASTGSFSGGNRRRKKTTMKDSEMTLGDTFRHIETIEKVRRVRTPAGAKRFGVPIGTPIPPGAGKGGVGAKVKGGPSGGGSREAREQALEGRVARRPAGKNKFDDIKPGGRGKAPGGGDILNPEPTSDYRKKRKEEKLRRFLEAGRGPTGSNERPRPKGHPKPKKVAAPRADPLLDSMYGDRYDRPKKKGGGPVTAEAARRRAEYQKAKSPQPKRRALTGEDRVSGHPMAYTYREAHKGEVRAGRRKAAGKGLYYETQSHISSGEHQVYGSDGVPHGYIWQTDTDWRNSSDGTGFRSPEEAAAALSATPRSQRRVDGIAGPRPKGVESPKQRAARLRRESKRKK